MIQIIIEVLPYYTVFQAIFSQEFTTNVQMLGQNEKQLLYEKQAGFRSIRGTVDHIFTAFGLAQICLCKMKRQSVFCFLQILLRLKLLNVCCMHHYCQTNQNMYTWQRIKSFAMNVDLQSVTIICVQRSRINKSV